MIRKLIQTILKSNPVYVYLGPEPYIIGIGAGEEKVDITREDADKIIQAFPGIGLDGDIIYGVKLEGKKDDWRYI